MGGSTVPASIWQKVCGQPASLCRGSLSLWNGARSQKNVATEHQWVLVTILIFQARQNQTPFKTLPFQCFSGKHSGPVSACLVSSLTPTRRFFLGDGFREGQSCSRGGQGEEAVGSPGAGDGSCAGTDAGQLPGPYEGGATAAGQGRRREGVGRVRWGHRE